MIVWCYATVALRYATEKNLHEKYWLKYSKKKSFSESDKVVLLLNFGHNWVQIISDRSEILNSISGTYYIKGWYVAFKYGEPNKTLSQYPHLFFNACTFDLCVDLGQQHQIDENISILRLRPLRKLKAVVYAKAVQ